jgi:MOSC domain-containing protein YiiM
VYIRKKKPPIETKLYKGPFRKNMLIIVTHINLSRLCIGNKLRVSSVT